MTTKKINPVSSPAKQAGIALVTILVMLTMLVLVAIVSMRTTNIDLKIAKNSRDKSVAFRISVDVAERVDDILQDHMFYRKWDNTVFRLPDGFNVVDPSSVLFDANVPDPFDFSAANIDLTYDSMDFDADIFVSRVGSDISTGAGLGLGEGYSGIGRGAAGGGGAVFFDISSRSEYINNASSLTGGYHQLTIRN